MGVIHEIGIQPIYYLPSDKDKASDIMAKVLKEYPVKAPESAEKPTETEPEQEPETRDPTSRHKEAFNEAKKQLGPDAKWGDLLELAAKIQAGKP